MWSLALPVACMDVVDWLEEQGYVANYPGEWVVLSGHTIVADDKPSNHKLEFHGKKRKDAMDVIELLWTTTPELWTVAIKIPEKPGTQENLD